MEVLGVLEDAASSRLRGLADPERLRELAGRLGGATAAPPARQLQALFSAALRHGAASLVVHYVHEVCLDVTAVSADATEAYLLDGAIVRDWAAGESERLGRTLTAGVGSEAAASALDAAAAELAGLCHVYDALGEGASAAGSRARALAGQAAALAWCARAGLLGACGRRFGGPGAWAASVARRRSAAAPRKLFLDEMLAALGGRVAYPPKTTEAAVRDIFAFSDGATDAHEEQQHALLLYFLHDAGHAADSAPTSAARALGIPPRVALQAYAAFLLDDSEREASLDEACRLLAPAPPTLPFGFVEALAARDRPDAALALIRARPVPSPHDLASTLAGVQVRLACGLLTEAFLVARTHCTACPAEASGEAAKSLVRVVAEHCEAIRALDELLALPFDGVMEAALVTWLRSRAGTLSGEQLPLYYLRRGRSVEAAAAHVALSALPDDPSASEGQREVRAEAQRRRASLLSEAVASLPPLQRGLVPMEAAPLRKQLEVSRPSQSLAAGTIASLAPPEARPEWEVRVAPIVAGGPTPFLRPPSMSRPVLAAVDIPGAEPPAPQPTPQMPPPDPLASPFPVGSAPPAAATPGSGGLWVPSGTKGTPLLFGAPFSGAAPSPARPFMLTPAEALRSPNDDDAPMEPSPPLLGGAAADTTAAPLGDEAMDTSDILSEFLEPTAGFGSPPQEHRRRSTRRR